MRVEEAAPVLTVSLSAGVRSPVRVDVGVGVGVLVGVRQLRGSNLPLGATDTHDW